MIMKVENIKNIILNNEIKKLSKQMFYFSNETYCKPSQIPSLKVT